MQVAGRSVIVELQGEPAGELTAAYEAAALSGWFYALRRIRALRGDADLPAVRLVALRILVSQQGVTFEQIDRMTAAAMYRALGGSVPEERTSIPELP